MVWVSLGVAQVREGGQEEEESGHFKGEMDNSSEAAQENDEHMTVSWSWTVYCFFVFSLPSLYL